MINVAVTEITVELFRTKLLAQLLDNGMVIVTVTTVCGARLVKLVGEMVAVAPTIDSCVSVD